MYSEALNTENKKNGRRKIQMVLNNQVGPFDE